MSKDSSDEDKRFYSERLDDYVNSKIHAMLKSLLTDGGFGFSQRLQNINFIDKNGNARVGRLSVVAPSIGATVTVDPKTGAMSQGDLRAIGERLAITYEVDGLTLAMPIDNDCAMRLLKEAMSASEASSVEEKDESV